MQARSGLAVLAVLGAAMLVAGWSVNSASRPAPEPEATEVLQAEPLAIAVPAVPSQSQLLAAHELTKSLMTVAYPVPGVDWPDTAADAPAAGQALRDADTAGKKAEGKPGGMPDRAMLAKLSAAVFSDRQLASIKDRLKLTPEQARYWPAVEDALRALSWHRQRGRPGVADGTLDPSGVRTLVTAAAPLVLTLREEQKREVRTLAHLIGLEQLASQI